MIVVAQLALVLWGVILIFGMFAWAVVAAVWELVRRINQRSSDADPWPDLETGKRPADG